MITVRTGWLLTVSGLVLAFAGAYPAKWEYQAALCLSGMSILMLGLMLITPKDDGSGPWQNP